MNQDLERLADELGPRVATELVSAAREGVLEAQFRRAAERVFEEVASRAHLTVTPQMEYQVARGQVDAVYNRLIIEFKKPGAIRPRSAHANKAIVEQVKRYVTEVASRERREAQRFAGVALDGRHFLFVRRVGEGWLVEDPVPVNAGSTSRFLRLLFALSTGKALIVDNLIEAFGPSTYHARRAVRALYDALTTNRHPLVGKLFEQWQTFYSEATDYAEWASRLEGKREFSSFVTGMGLDREKASPTPVFYVIHTYYALLIKLIASMAAAQFASGTTESFSRLASKTGAELLEQLHHLEEGGVFVQYGIRNFLEGDFFRWYLHTWEPGVEQAIRSMIQRLAEFDPEALELAPEHARDLLKKLYHGLLPREIRHDLGEYYTPDWLAERVIRHTLGQTDLGKADRRVLDPACGSGTFLVLLIKHIRDRQERNKREPSETLGLILKNIIGFDLNPLAVIAARTNYLLALGDLLKHRTGDIAIPVYQADSVLTPSRGIGLERQVFVLKTAVGVFRVPAVFADRQKLDALTLILGDYVKSGAGAEAFVAKAAAAGELDLQDVDSVGDILRTLYLDLRRLHEEGMDGVWAGIIRNAFAPLFVEPCHYVVGNPPWINWEHLPDDYRRDTMPLWEHYGLFPHSGMDTILGKGKKDISLLMTYVCLEKYLRPGGSLGFVLSQSVFKTSGSSQGFRRFCLPDGTPFAPVLVEDLVDLKPFEGATNRPVWALFLKGRRTAYPVPYSRLRKAKPGREGSFGFDTPYEEVIEHRTTYTKWYAKPINAADVTSSWLTASEWALKALGKVCGKSHYRAHAGSYTGGANAVFWLEVAAQRPGGLAMVSNVTEGARRKVSQVHSAIETDLIYPLLRGRDVQRWKASPSASILMVQDPAKRRGIDEETMAIRYPRAFSYLSRFEALLRQRAAYRRYYRDSDPFWTMFNVSDFTFAEAKVVWREVGNEVDAAVIGSADCCGVAKPIIPDHTCILVACEEDEAHYLCAVLNSSPARLAIRNYVVLHPDPHVLDHIGIPQYSPKNEYHRSLARLSRQAHGAARREDQSELTRIEGDIDAIVGELWGLSAREMDEIKTSLREV